MLLKQPEDVYRSPSSAQMHIKSWEIQKEKGIRKMDQEVVPYDPKGGSLQQRGFVMNGCIKLRLHLSVGRPEQRMD